jgi:hypothetical protein
MLGINRQHKNQNCRRVRWLDSFNEQQQHGFSCRSVIITNTKAVHFSITRHLTSSVLRFTLVKLLWDSVFRSLPGSVHSPFFFYFLEWGKTVCLERRPLFGPLNQPRIINDECGAVVGMRIGIGNRSIRRKPIAVPL